MREPGYEEPLPGEESAQGVVGAPTKGGASLPQWAIVAMSVAAFAAIVLGVVLLAR